MDICKLVKRWETENTKAEVKTKQKFKMLFKREYSSDRMNKLCE